MQHHGFLHAEPRCSFFLARGGQEIQGRLRIPPRPTGSRSTPLIVSGIERDVYLVLDDFGRNAMPREQKITLGEMRSSGTQLAAGLLRGL